VLGKGKNTALMPDQVIDALCRRIPGTTATQFRGQHRVVIPRDGLFGGLAALRDAHGFDLLVDITCVDYLYYRGGGIGHPRPAARFGLVYLLSNISTASRLTVRVMLDEPDLSVPSVVTLWEGANWLEREVWDMFGVRFEGHPDLRRILLPEEFTAHPLRKDYPLQGRGERHNFPVIARSQS
jgi:NADH-quinone oxidoreductase subunit C